MQQITSSVSRPSETGWPTVVKLVIEPIFEADFHNTSDGFRTKMSARDAVENLCYSLNRGTAYINIIYSSVV